MVGEIRTSCFRFLIQWLQNGDFMGPSPMRFEGGLSERIPLEMFEGLVYVPKVCSIYIGNQDRTKTSAVFACRSSWPSGWTGLNEACSEGERTRGHRMMYCLVSWWGCRDVGTFHVFVDKLGIRTTGVTRGWSRWSTLCTIGRGSQTEGEGSERSEGARLDLGAPGMVHQWYPEMDGWCISTGKSNGKSPEMDDWG